MKKPFLIAEIAQAHNGSFKKALDYINALAKTGVDAIKFQTHIADAESSVHEPFRVRFSDDKTRFAYWKRMEFSLEQWQELKQACDEQDVEFMSSPFSNAAVDLLEKIGVKRYKIGSGEVNNFLLLKKISQTGKPIILSSGMSSYEELDKTVNFLHQQNVDFSILQCTTSYPTKPEHYGLNIIQELKARYGVKVGFSDHSAKIETCIAATALGAEILEFHAVLDRKNDGGPDALSSLEMEEITTLVEQVKTIYTAQQNKVDKRDNSHFTELKGIFEKSLSINKDLPARHLLQFEDLEAKKPKNYGIDAAQFERVIGKKLSNSMKKWDFLNENDLMHE
ncbi:N-acetylneuraminate synthase family protein [Flavimarina sp. Hel_I_48]|uniref:N-acetylneuraminate synthase family protein n=1 Tax=Flavimarina sp. Hel_I_48 TaxID=1392488 RepID=UPI0004DEF9BF|nr:N-acetylneuraminate synthase family protein [Flavimarina sp. Hel_I_48]